MKKKLLIIISLLLVAFIGISVFAFIQLNSVISLLKPKIEAKVSELTGAELKINSINAKFFPQVGLNIDGVEFKKPGLVATKFGNITAILELLPLLSKNLKVKEFKVSNGDISLTVPNINTPINLSEIDLSTAVSITAVSLTEQTLELSNLKLTAKALDKLPLSFDLATAMVSVFDKNLSAQNIKANFNKIPLSINKLDFSLPTKNIATSVINTNFDLSILTELVAVLFDKGLIKIPPIASPKGSLKFTGDFSVANSQVKGEGSASLSDVAVALLGNSVEGLKLDSTFKIHDNVTDVITKNINLTAKALAYQNGTPVVINITELTNKLSFDNLKVDFLVNALTASLLGETLELKTSSGEFQGQNLKVNNFDVAGLGGQINGDAKLSLGDKGFNVKAKAKDLSIPSIMTLIKNKDNEALVQKLKGTIPNLDLNLSGEITNPVGTSSGEISVQLKETYLEGINFVKSVFKEINALPILGDIIKLKLPPSINDAIQSEITPIHDLKTHISLNRGVANIKDLDMLSDLFTLTGDGSFNLLNKGIDFSSTFFLKTDVTNELVNRVKELKYGVNSRGLLEVPIEVTGTVPMVIVVPNVKKLASQAGGEVIKEKAKDALKDIINKKTNGIGGQLLDSLF